MNAIDFFGDTPAVAIIEITRLALWTIGGLDLLVVVVGEVEVAYRGSLALSVVGEVARPFGARGFEKLVCGVVLVGELVLANAVMVEIIAILGHVVTTTIDAAVGADEFAPGIEGEAGELALFGRGLLFHNSLAQLVVAVFESQ